MNYSKLTKDELVTECKKLESEREALSKKLNEKTSRGSKTREALLKKLSALDESGKPKTKTPFVIASVICVLVALALVSQNALYTPETEYALDMVRYENVEGGHMSFLKPVDHGMELNGENHWSKWAIDNGFRYVVYGGTIYDGKYILFINGETLSIEELSSIIDPSKTLLLLDNPDGYDVPGYKYVSKGMFTAEMQRVKFMGFVPTTKKQEVFESHNIRGYVDKDILYVDLRASK